MKNTIKLKLNQDLKGFKAGSILTFDNGNMRLDAFWRARINDSKLDNCVTIINQSLQKILKTEKPVKDDYKKIKRGKQDHGYK